MIEFIGIVASIVVILTSSRLLLNRKDNPDLSKAENHLGKFKYRISLGVGVAALLAFLIIITMQSVE